MSYDLRFAVKGIDQKMYVVFEPDMNSPTYNLSKVFRAAMDWDFKQSEWYLVRDILPNIERGVIELEMNGMDYKRYELGDGYGTVDGALKVLRGLRYDIYKHLNGYDWNDYSLDNLYICW